MTELTPQQRQEITERLATEVMGWRKRSTSYPNNRLSTFWETEETKDKMYGVGYAYECHSDEYEGWNPLEDWNHFRMVEEKVMENPQLLDAFLLRFDAMPNERSIVKPYMRSSLDERCLDLIDALDSLKKHD